MKRSVIYPLLAAACALALTAFAAGGCAGEREPEPAAPARRPNFVVVVGDTLRAGHLQLNSDEKIHSPNFDALRAGGTFFANARSTSSWTLPATASLFLSQLPSQHGVTRWASLLGDEHTTLVETLADAGYRTGGWSANRLLTRTRGFVQGFDDFDLLMHPKWKPGMPAHSRYAFATAEDLTSRALAWLDETSAEAGDNPFFLYLHLMEPHTPFLCPPKAGNDCQLVATALNRRLSATQWEFDEVQKSYIQKFYAADVRRMDDALGRLHSELGERGLLDNTWLIVTSDHGEMLGEHGLFVHGNALYEETLQIPLLFRGPTDRRAVVTAPVSLVDVAPTIVDLAGIQRPAAFKGRSLRPALEARRLPPVPIVAELLPVHDELNKRHRHLVAVTRGTEKLVLGVDGRLERFDLLQDPDEEVPLPAEMSELEDLLSRAGVPFRHLEALSEIGPELTPEMIEHLKGLGYVQE